MRAGSGLDWPRRFEGAEATGVTALVIVEILEVVDEQAYAEYRARVTPTVTDAGGTYLARSNEVGVLEGDWRPHRIVVLQFPTLAAARNWWSGEAYRELKALRQRATTTNMVLVEGSRHVPG